MEKNCKMNMNIVNANVKLQDEIKWIKNDNDILQKRMDFVKKELKSKVDKFKEFNLEKDIQDAIDMLEGNYIFEDGRKKKNVKF